MSIAPPRHYVLGGSCRVLIVDQDLAIRLKCRRVKNVRHNVVREKNHSNPPVRSCLSDLDDFPPQRRSCELATIRNHYRMVPVMTEYSV